MSAPAPESHQEITRVRLAAIAIAMALLTVVLYWPATRNDFVSYDDDLYVTENGHVRSSLSRENVVWAWTTTDVASWHPITWLSYMLDAQLFGIAPRPFHLTSIVLHAVNVALLLWLLQRATGWLVPSVLVAALFAVHPLNVQSVVWVSERKSVLSTLFWLLAMLAYVAWARRPRALSYAALVGGLILSLLSKPMAVTLPFVLLLLDYWPLARQHVGWRRLVVEKAPLMAIAAAFCVFTYRVQAASGAAVGSATIPIAERAGNAIWSYVAYLGKAIRPVGLTAFDPYAQEPLPLWQIGIALACLLTVTAALVASRNRARPLLVGWLWYLGTLVPMIGIVHVGSQAMADRDAYVPLIGVFIMVAWAGALLVRQGQLPTVVAVGSATVLVVTLSARTVRQISVWQNSRTLFEQTIRYQPDAWVAHYNLGNIYAKMGRREDAVRRFQDAVRLAPEFAPAHDGLGGALAALGRRDEAIASYARAILLKPDFAEAHNNIGIALAAQGKAEEGANHLRTALQLRPNFTQARINLAICLRQLGRYDQSLAEVNRVLAESPGSSVALYHRALTLARFGDLNGVRRDLAALEASAPDVAAALRKVLNIDLSGVR